MRGERMDGLAVVDEPFEFDHLGCEVKIDQSVSRQVLKATKRDWGIDRLRRLPLSVDNQPSSQNHRRKERPIAK